MHKKLTQTILRKVEEWIGVQLNGRVRYRVTITRRKPRIHRKIRFTQEKKSARVHVSSRLSEIADIHGVSYNRFRLSSAKTRWGSCSRKRNINLNWKLFYAPPVVLDYVIIHELSHLTHMNHSKAFWAHVEKMMPDYKVHRTWLKKNGHHLSRAPNVIPATY